MLTSIAACAKQHNLRLTGSFATAEAHIPSASEGLVRSFSDIDLLSEQDLSAGSEHEISTNLLQSAARMGLSVSGVSIRSEALIAQLPHACDWREEALDEILAADSIALRRFWTAVAAIEGTIVVAKCKHRRTEEVIAYVTAKFWFMLVKLAALMQGTILRSYRSMVDWSLLHWELLPVEHLFDIKVGDINTLMLDSAEMLFADEVLSDLCGGDVACAALAEDVRLFARDAMPLRPAHYFELAQQNAYSETLRRIERYENQKLRRAQMSSVPVPER